MRLQKSIFTASMTLLLHSGFAFGASSGTKQVFRLSKRAFFTSQGKAPIGLVFMRLADVNSETANAAVIDTKISQALSHVQANPTAVNPIDKSWKKYFKAYGLSSQVSASFVRIWGGAKKGNFSRHFPAVNYLNALGLQHHCCVGNWDQKQITGQFHVMNAPHDMEYKVLYGAQASATVNAGHVIYADESAAPVLSADLVASQSNLALVDKDTKDLVVTLEYIGDDCFSAAAAAVADIKETLPQAFPGATVVASDCITADSFAADQDTLEFSL